MCTLSAARRRPLLEILAFPNRRTTYCKSSFLDPGTCNLFQSVRLSVHRALKNEVEYMFRAISCACFKARFPKFETPWKSGVSSTKHVALTEDVYCLASAALGGRRGVNLEYISNHTLNALSNCGISKTIQQQINDECARSLFLFDPLYPSGNWNAPGP